MRPPKGRVGPLPVVLLEPSLDHVSGFINRAELPAVEAAVAKGAVETLVVAALAGAM